MIMRLGCLLPLLSLGLLALGGQGLYTIATNRKPLEISIQDFYKQTPDAKWLKVTGGELDTLNSVFTSRTSGSDAKEIYVPVVAPGEDSTTGNIRLLLLTKDPELVGFINEGRKIEAGGGSPEKAIEFAAKNADKLRPKRDVEGLVQFGIESDSKKRDKVAKLYPNLDSNAAIIEDGKRPDLAQASLMTALGLLLGALVVRGHLKKAEPQPQGPPPMPPAA
ncbi:hypothetical protein [Haloferula sp. BvORR071]|uniref:hypothetical protein n=1 Tax=Haloferula sp. BvORR071 TaxID=1396141 RepID=UPI000551AAF7|nr:hypothetical protein [Haloferula sp. BvORR071]